MVRRQNLEAIVWANIMNMVRIFLKFNTGVTNQQTMYIYRINTIPMQWLCSNYPGKPSGSLLNFSSSETVPEAGWRYHKSYVGKMGWKFEDSTLRVSEGPMVLCGDITITITSHIAEKFPDCMHCDHLLSQISI